MAQNVTIAGASYTDVPAVSIPKTGGGLATFYDASGIDYAGSPTSGGNANVTNAILFGRCDSTSTATAFTATVDGLDSLYDGAAVMLRNGVVTSASGFTVNVNGLGAKPVYNNMATGNEATPTNPTRDTTIFNINYTMLLVYDSELVDGGAWICYRGYDGNTNTIGYQLRTNSGNRPMSDAAYRYRLYFTSADGSKWVPANTSTSTDATTARTLNTRAIDPFGPIVYNSTNGTTSSGSRPAVGTLWQQYALTIGYSYVKTLTAWDSVWLKCQPNSDGSAVMEDIVQALPTSKDGYIYILLGMAYSTTAMELRSEHPVYWHDGTGIRMWTGAEGGSSVDPATATPIMDGTAAVGSSAKYAREDHVHPTDTSRQATLVSGTNIKTVGSQSLLGSGNLTVANIGAAASSHAHGSITSAGAITSDTAVASGDKLIIADSSASSVLKRSGIAFGTDTTTFLRNDGQWAEAGGSSNRISSSDSTSGGAMASAYVQTLADASHNNAIIQLVAYYMGSGGTPYNVNTLGITSNSVTINDNPVPTMQTATASIATTGWSNNSKTVNVTGVTASNNVIVSPAPTSVADWASCGIYCSAQGSETLTFTCTTVPSSALTANVLILG